MNRRSFLELSLGFIGAAGFRVEEKSPLAIEMDLKSLIQFVSDCGIKVDNEIENVLKGELNFKIGSEYFIIKNSEFIPVKGFDEVADLSERIEKSRKAFKLWSAIIKKEELQVFEISGYLAYLDIIFNYKYLDQIFVSLAVEQKFTTISFYKQQQRLGKLIVINL